MKNEEQDQPEELEEVEMRVWDCGSPLYDSYELAALGHVIDRHTMALPSPCGSRRFSFRVVQRVKTASFRDMNGLVWRKKVGCGGKEAKSKKSKKVFKNGLSRLRRVCFLFGVRPVRPV